MLYYSFQQIADRIGATKEEVYEAINKALSKVVNESWFANRVSENALNAILKTWGEKHILFLFVI